MPGWPIFPSLLVPPWSTAHPATLLVSRSLLPTIAEQHTHGRVGNNNKGIEQGEGWQRGKKESEVMMAMDCYHTVNGTMPSIEASSRSRWDSRQRGAANQIAAVFSPRTRKKERRREEGKDLGEREKSAVPEDSCDLFRQRFCFVLPYPPFPSPQKKIPAAWLPHIHNK